MIEKQSLKLKQRHKLVTAVVSALTFWDRNLQPFTYYGYNIEVRNAVGTSRSVQVVFETLAGNPSADMNLTVSSSINRLGITSLVKVHIHNFLQC